MTTHTRRNDTRIAIAADGLGKRFHFGRPKPRYRTLSESVLSSARGRVESARRLLRGGGEPPTDDVFWALKDVSFEIRAGESVGIIGRNGAGKSTLLKILSRITEPTTGHVDIRGRVASLLEVGTGFHLELSGRENVYLNGAILGMKRTEIDRKFDEIVAFAEVEKFIDTAVKHYSSGMYLRLAFAVAAHLEPEILLVDEVLAVGDAEFQRKCLGKMDGVAREGRTIVFVSHNMGAMSAHCSRGIYLEGGRVVEDAPMGDVIARYLASVREISATPLAERADRTGEGGARVTSIAVTDAVGNPIRELMSGQECLLVIGYDASRPLRRPAFKVTIFNSVGQPLIPLQSALVDAEFPELAGPGRAVCRLQRLPLSKGTYWMDVSLADRGHVLDAVSGAYSFVVERGDFYGTGRNVDRLTDLCLVEQEWSSEDAARPGSRDELVRVSAPAVSD